MIRKIYILFILYLIVNVVVIFSLVTRRSYKPNSKNILSTAKIQAKDTGGVFVFETDPEKLAIPSRNIIASIESVGVNSQNEMTVPSNPDVLAWYQNSSLPGQLGSSIIAGHVNDINGKPAVFADLSKIQNGELIYLKNNSGTTKVYKVFEKYEVADTQDEADKVFRGNTDEKILVLITCSGTWNQKTNNYPNRLIVKAQSID